MCLTFKCDGHDPCLEQYIRLFPSYKIESEVFRFHKAKLRLQKQYSANQQVVFLYRLGSLLCFTVISVPHSDYGYIKSLWICIKLLRGVFGSLSTGYHYMDVERSRSVSVSFSHTPLQSLWEYAGNMSARLCVQDTFVPSGSVKNSTACKKKNTPKKGPGAGFFFVVFFSRPEQRGVCVTG